MEQVLDRFDCRWFTSKLNKKVVSIEWENVACAGLMGSVMKAKLQLNSETFQNVILKVLLSDTTTADRMKVALKIGAAREADFYNAMKKVPDDFQALLQSCLPSVYHAECDWASGEKTIIMEDLSPGVTATLCFGPNIPANWGTDQAVLASAQLDADPLEVIRHSFLSIARFHALFWNYDFHAMPWLEGYQWTQGKGQAEWEADMSVCKSGNMVNRVLKKFCLVMTSVN